MTKQATQNLQPLSEATASTDDLKQNLDNRVASAATRVSADNTSKVAAEKATASSLPGGLEDETPNLPGANRGWNSQI